MDYFKETGNGEYKLFAIGSEPEDMKKYLFMEGSKDECVALYRKLQEDKLPELEGTTLIICSPVGFPICAA